VETEGATLSLFPFPRNFERGFHAGIEHGACFGITIYQWRTKSGISGWIGNEEIRDQWIRTWRKNRFAKIAGSVVVGGSKSGARHDAQPAEVGVGVKELIKGIDPPGLIAFEDRTLPKISVKIRQTDLALVEDRAVQNGG